MGVHEVWVAGIPGLKSETWGTLRVIPLILVGVEGNYISWLGRFREVIALIHFRHAP
jgi:hypothetical protein